MELRDIKTFLIIAETKKMNLAAQIMHYSQPTLTARINKLEDELGIKILERTAQGVSLTPAGERFYPYACDINKLTEEALSEISMLRNHHRSRLIVGASFFISCYGLPEIVAEYNKHHPDVFLDIRTMKGKDVITKVENGEIQVGVCRKYATKSSTSVTLIRHEPIELCVPPDHPLCHRPKIFMADLSSIPMLGNSINGYWKQVEECFQNAGIRMNINMSFDNIESIKQFILHGGGISFLPWPAVKNEVDRGMLRTVHVSDFYIQHETYVYSPPYDQLDTPAKDFLDMLNYLDFSGKKS